MYSVPEAAAALGTTEEDVRDRVSAGRLIAIEDEDGTLQVPRVQFAAGDLLPGLEDVLAAMNVRAAWMRLQLLVENDVQIHVPWQELPHFILLPEHVTLRWEHFDDAGLPVRIASWRCSRVEIMGIMCLDLRLDLTERSTGRGSR